MLGRAHGGKGSTAPCVPGGEPWRAFSGTKVWHEWQNSLSRNNLSVSDDGSIGDTIIVGNGVNDVVSVIGSSFDTFTLGKGAGDSVNTDN
jgi:hypothetical protein